jgi:hypothetical protein
MAEHHHEHGKMDVTNHEKTFAGFIRFVTNTVIGIVIFLILLYGLNG